MGQGLSGAKNKLAGVLGGGSDSSSEAAASGGSKPPAEGQYTVQEALKLQQALKAAFAEEQFQKLLKLAQDRHPRRGQRGHADQTAFTVQLQSLLLHVYRTVLPQSPWCLQPGWEGYREMMLKMTSASEDPRVIQAREDINRLLGLPRHTVIQPPAAEPVFVETPDGSGRNQGLLGAPLIRDDDGDYAHEFWEEKGGQLVLITPQGAAGG
mmetsp:Transcript_14418/g.27013  ORF Transcript_14418/g.27013 Transcript_14418/m.27013 type:complete len:210 (-) Transcript_14418:111-740(-)